MKGSPVSSFDSRMLSSQPRHTERTQDVGRPVQLLQEAASSRPPDFGLRRERRPKVEREVGALRSAGFLAQVPKWLRRKNDGPVGWTVQATPTPEPGDPL